MTWTTFQPHVRHLSASDQTRIRRAYEMGEELHREQKRLSGEPYFTHPVAVAKDLAEMGADPDTLIAALLHDTIEDTPATLQDLDAAFDGQVVSLIEGVTKLCATDLPEKSKLNEQIETLRKMFTLMERDVRIMVIKLADRLHNIRTGSFLPEEKRMVLAQETQDVYVKIADRLCMQDLRDEMQERCLAILKPDLYAQLVQLREENERKSESVMPGMETLLRRLHPQLMVRTKVKTEPKQWDKLFAQHEAKGAVVSGLSAVTVVFLCPDREACYRVLGALHESWQREAMSFQDFINSPVANGYQGVHTTIILADGTRVRCKIRTQEMDEYYHRGVTMFCFRPQTPESLQALLPWTKRISTVASETKERSLEFWESLQNDILGETITIHGPNDQAIQLPRGSTVLDGAFYLFLENALFVETLKINGKEVMFNTPLQNAISLDVSFSPLMTVQRDWLPWVQTRLSVAMIRAALADHSEEERAREGQEILQRILTERRRGFLEEFDESILAKRLEPLGFVSLEEACIAIADGRADAKEIFDTLFRHGPAPQKPRSIAIQYGANLSNVETSARLSETHRRFGEHIREIRSTWERSGEVTVTLKADLSEPEAEALQRDLANAGATRVVTVVRMRKEVFLLALIITLWGLDPVFARAILTRLPVAPVDMMIVRFWSLSVLSLFMLLWTRAKHPLAEVPLPLRNLSLWVSVACLLAVAFTTYFSLEWTLPSHYTIPMTAAGLVLMSLAHRHQRRALAATWGLLGIGILLLILYTPEWTAGGIASTFLAVVSFTVFSIVSERYKRVERVDIRVAQYFFILSLFCALPTLALLPFSNLAVLPPGIIGVLVLFSILIAGLPYYLYYLLLSHREIDFVMRYSYLLIPVTLAGQVLFGEPLAPVTLVVAGIVILGAAILSLSHRYNFRRQPPPLSDERIPSPE